jgi:sugar lactone lactonase YvrE
MKRYLAFLLFGIVSAACSQQGETADLGSGAMDQAATDQDGPLDGGTDGPIVNGRQLVLVAGGLGGSGDADGVGRTARFRAPEHIVFDGVANAYISDTGNHTIRKMVLGTGQVLTIAGSPGQSGSSDGIGAAARFDDPAGVALDGAGNLYVADSGNFTIRKIVLGTGQVSTIAGTPGTTGRADGIGPAAQFLHPDGLAADGTHLYIADYSAHTIRKLVLSTGEVSTLAGIGGVNGSTDGTGAAARFSVPRGLALDGAGNMYVVEQGNHLVRRIVLSTAAVTTLAGSAGVSGSVDGTGTAARFYGPRAVIADGAGNLFISDGPTHVIRRLVLSTLAVTTVAGAAVMPGSVDAVGTMARFSSPHGLAVNTGGELLIVDSNNHSIRRMSMSAGVVSTIAGDWLKLGRVDASGPAARFRNPQGVVSDGTGSVYVSESTVGGIRKIDLATGAVTTTVGAPGGVGTPNGLALDGAGNLYVADVASHVIRQVVLSTGAVSTFAGGLGTAGSTDAMGTTARFRSPQGLAFDGAGNLYVSDGGNHTLRVIALSTRAVTTLAGSAMMMGIADGTGSAARFNSPHGLAWGGNGTLYVADNANHTIRKVVVATGEVTTLAGEAPYSGSADDVGAGARFNAPAGLAVDGTGNLYVSETLNRTVRKIELATQTVTTLVGRTGRIGTQPTLLPGGLSQPSGLVVTPAGELLIADFGEHGVLAVR